ncbi:MULTISPECIES: hypothetical protein [unclassified Streptomyces]|uniref:hypothetical protein n=1 Tax=unclassified Streptomyces TaxID=2593676 RepID=UPI002DDB2A20|nr:hypothetical protein [Streptomyces sp. NBC_01237]WRZ76178.1 hypothetical protein OG251_33680 [Streptomyces sp. NBC_01237]
MSEAPYVRFQGTERSPRGHFPGVFALANGLAREGRLSEEQHRFWRAGNDWYDSSFTNPSDVDPSVYDPAVNPGAVAWFKVTAVELIARVDGYLTLLAAHRVPCERVESADPGTIVYEDADQVVVVPHPRSNESATATTLDNSRTPQG